MRRLFSYCPKFSITPFLTSAFQIYPVRFIKFRSTPNHIRPLRAKNQILLYNSQLYVERGEDKKKLQHWNWIFAPTSCTLTVHSRTSGPDSASFPFRTMQTKPWRGNGFGRFQYFSSISGASKSSSVKCRPAIEMRSLILT